MALYNFFIFLSILTEDGWKLASELTSKDKIKTSSGFIQVISTKIEHLKEKTNVYNLNVLGYHTYVVGNGLLVAHNRCNPNGRKGCQAHQDKIDDLANKPKKPKKVGEDQMKRGEAHILKKDVLKDPSLNIKDTKISHYDIYQDTADNGRLWLNSKSDKSI